MSSSASVREASELLQRVAGPRDGGIKQTITNAARKLGLGYSRTKDIWYRQARRIDAHEIDLLRVEAAKQAATYDRIANAMASTDADFYSADIAALVHAARTLRGVGGT